MWQLNHKKNLVPGIIFKTCEEFSVFYSNEHMCSIITFHINLQKLAIIFVQHSSEDSD